MTTLVGHQVVLASWMALRSSIYLHLAVPSFNRRNVLAAARSRGFTGRTLEQARVWVDEQCDALGLARDAGLPARHARGEAPEA
jgi:hypothetical protein